MLSSAWEVGVQIQRSRQAKRQSLPHGPSHAFHEPVAVTPCGLYLTTTIIVKHRRRNGPQHPAQRSEPAMSMRSLFDAPESAEVSAVAGALPHHPALAGTERLEIEHFIYDVFARRFDACVPVFMPELVARRDACGRVVAAAGIRVADEPLYLEQYLDAPVECCIERLTGQRPARAQVAEVGQLAAASAGEGQRMIVELAFRLTDRRIEWVVATLTRELRQRFVRMGIRPLLLNEADPGRLRGGSSDWGRYYEHNPVVLAGHLPSAMSRLQGV